jgi:hypothetical protein
MGKIQPSVQWGEKKSEAKWTKGWLGKLIAKHPHLALHMTSNANNANQKVNYKRSYLKNGCAIFLKYSPENVIYTFFNQLFKKRYTCYNP